MVQDVHTGRALMLAWMDRESLRRTIALGETVFWSRSRQEYWHKGATSGNTQRVVHLAVDCDGDTCSSSSTLLRLRLPYRGGELFLSSCVKGEIGRLRDWEIKRLTVAPTINLLVS
ncbi:MAG: phosphoribosyl-AMP cyclohydrolase [Caldilineaceae bacterium]